MLLCSSMNMHSGTRVVVRKKAEQIGKEAEMRQTLSVFITL